jgi:hypothetical protein
MIPDQRRKVDYSKLTQEPITHFLVLALVIFALFEITSPTDDKLLEIDRSEINARIFLQEISSGEAATELQRSAIELAYVEEQLLVKDAQALGLDNDARIDDMLAQKMRHVLSGELIQPTSEELENFYQSNIERYRTEPTVTLDEIIMNDNGEVSEELAQLFAAGTDIAELTNQFDSSAGFLPRVTRADMNNIFEVDFARQVFAAQISQWVGPFISNRGQHWLQLKSRTDALLPQLAEITDLVRLDWIAQEEENRLQIEIDKLLESYSILINEDAELL